MFIKKTSAQLETMTDAERDSYIAEKELHDAEMQTKAVKEAVEKGIEETKKTLTKVEQSLKDANDEITLLKEKGVQGIGSESVSSQIKKGIEDNFEKIKEIQKSGTGFIEIVVKAPTTVTTTSGTTLVANNLTGTQLAPLSNINLREIPVIALTTNMNTDKETYYYSEVVPKDGDYSFVAEGTIKPQIDFTWETNTARTSKIAAFMKLSMESVQDVAGLQSIAENYLLNKHNLFKQKAILFGTGLLGQPKGATTYGRVFSAGALALSVAEPNIMDVINACVTDIATTHNYADEIPYRANLVMMNPNDFFINLVSAKAGITGQPLYPTATLFNEVVIAGMRIIPEESIPAGKIFVADMSKYNTTNYMPYVVRIGYVNDDFVKNLFVILGESRFHAFVKKLDEQAFIYDDIDVIKTAITKP